MLQHMPSNKATGSDGLGARILKVAAPAISLPLSGLINHCIDTHNFTLAGNLLKLHLLFFWCSKFQWASDYYYKVLVLTLTW